jgi:hypothetical protein
MRSINRSTVLDLIRQQSPIARSEIARKLSMGLPTVVRIVDELDADRREQIDGIYQAAQGALAR